MRNFFSVLATPLVSLFRPLCGAVSSSVVCDDGIYLSYLLTVCTIIIGVAPITHYTHVCHKNCNTQGSSPNLVKVFFHTLRNCS